MSRRSRNMSRLHRKTHGSCFLWENFVLKSKAYSFIITEKTLCCEGCYTFGNWSFCLSVPPIPCSTDSQMKCVNLLILSWTGSSKFYDYCDDFNSTIFSVLPRFIKLDLPMIWVKLPILILTLQRRLKSCLRTLCLISEDIAWCRLTWKLDYKLLVSLFLLITDRKLEPKDLKTSGLWYIPLFLIACKIIFAPR